MNRKERAERREAKDRRRREYRRKTKQMVREFGDNDELIEMDFRYENQSQERGSRNR